MDIASIAPAPIATCSTSDYLPLGKSSYVDEADSLCTPKSLPIEETFIGKALEEGRADVIEKHFESWLSFFDYVDRRRDIAKALFYAAQLPVEKSEKSISYLLGQVMPRFLTQPKKLIDHALVNKHVFLLKYCLQQFPEKMSRALEISAMEGTLNKTELLLSAGVNPNQDLFWPEYKPKDPNYLVKLLGRECSISRFGSLMNFVIGVQVPADIKTIKLLLKYQKDEYNFNNLSPLKKALKFAIYRYEETHQDVHYFRIVELIAKKLNLELARIGIGRNYSKLRYHCCSKVDIPIEENIISSEENISGIPSEIESVLREESIVTKFCRTDEEYSQEIKSNHKWLFGWKSVLAVIGVADIVFGYLLSLT